MGDAPDFDIRRRDAAAPRIPAKADIPRMLRFVELALFLSPFLLFAAWRLTAYAGGPSTHVVAASCVLLALLLGALLWFQREGALPSGTTYVPATLHDGRIIPGHGAPPP
jgi:Family of unknown function (DUF6111)